MLRRMLGILPSVHAACLRCGQRAALSGAGHCAPCCAELHALSSRLPTLSGPVLPVLRPGRPQVATLRIRYTYGQIGVAALLGSVTTAVVLSVLLARGGHLALAPDSRAEPVRPARLAAP
jgi:hypothetical protein